MFAVPSTQHRGPPSPLFHIKYNKSVVFFAHSGMITTSKRHANHRGSSMKKFTLQTGTPATYDGVSNTISFRSGLADVHVDFMSENYTFSLMIEDGTEDEVYPVNITASNISESVLDDFSTNATDNKETLLRDVREAIERLNPNCSRKMAYSGI
jgi:hypothetical protein